MEIRVPHEVFYQTTSSVPVAQAVEALLGTERLLLDLGSVLEGLVPGLAANTRVYVNEISEGSFKEIVWAAIFVAYQGDLEKEVPPLVDQLLGTHLSGHYNATVTVIFLLLLFYGADYLYQKTTKSAEHSRIKTQLDGVVGEVARDFRTSEEHVRKVLHDRYTKSPRMKLLAKASARVFHPSKAQNNVEMLINQDRRIEPLLIAEVPSDAQLLDADETDSSAPVENVKIELHAQDMDRTKQGWAAVIPEISPARMKMTLFPPLKPEDIYTRKEIVGDVVLISKPNKAGKMEPHTFHLVRLRD